MVPKWVEFGTAFIEDLGKVSVQVLGIEHVAVAGIVLADIDGFEESVDVLHVGDITAETDDGVLAKYAETLDVCETGEGSVGGYIMIRR